MDITAIVSIIWIWRIWLNGIRSHHLPVTAETKPAQERQILALVEQTRTELVILARYMQILSPELCQALAGRAINIHHSFPAGFQALSPTIRLIREASS